MVEDTVEDMQKREENMKVERLVWSSNVMLEEGGRGKGRGGTNA